MVARLLFAVCFHVRVYVCMCRVCNAIPPILVSEQRLRLCCTLPDGKHNTGKVTAFLTSVVSFGERFE